MPQEYYHHALNIGVVDRDKLHRVDLERMRLAAEEQTNILCDAVGKAFLRPGFEHLGATNGGAKARLIPFAAGEDQIFGLEFSDGALKVWLDDDPISRVAVATTVQSGDFSASTGWTLGTAAGTVALITGGRLNLQAFGRGARAFGKQQVTVAGGDVGVKHALRVRVNDGRVRFRVGSTDGGQEYIKESTLYPGYHSLAFVPTGNFWIEFAAQSRILARVESVEVEAAGDMVLPTNWTEEDLPLIRTDQSLDVMFVACEGQRQQRIETRGDNSWSVCNYLADDGPFLIGDPSISLKPSVTEGAGILTSSLPFFSQDHVGAMFRLYHDGQRVITTLAAEDSYTPTIMVTGINEPDYNERDFTYTISGTWAGTLRVQRSLDGEDVGFNNFRREQASAVVDITANATFTNDDNDDNAIAYYRVGFPPGQYTSGAAVIDVSYAGGGGYGICRVTSYDTPTSVSIEITKPFSGLDFTREWRQGAWSDVVGWPSGVCFNEGRLWWAGADAFWGSVSDAYESFDEDFIGDASMISRSLAIGGRNVARWIVPMSRLIVGTNGSVATIQASSLEEILTPENTAVKRISKIGAARRDVALLAEDRALFVEAEGSAIYEISYDPSKGRFQTTEFSKLTTDIFTSGVTGVAVQNRPDQRIWTTTQTEDAVCIVFEPTQEVVAFIPISTDSETDQIESMIVLPSYDGQDRILASIKRVVDGVTSRRIERLALDSEAIPGDITKCLDSHVTFGAGSATVTLSHLVGRTVWAWVDGGYVEDEDGEPVEFVVSVGGTITLPSVPTIGGCAGLPYRGRYKSAKLEYGSGTSTSMMRNKTLAGIGLLMADFCRSGVKYGSEFDNADHPMFNLPDTINGKPVPADITVGPGETEMVNPVDAPILPDSRMCIELTKPATILALVMRFEGYGG